MQNNLKLKCAQKEEQKIIILMPTICGTWFKFFDINNWFAFVFQLFFFLLRFLFAIFGHGKIFEV